MRPLEEVSQFVALVRPLLRAGHAVTSVGQLSRWARIDDARARRTITRMSEAFRGDPLVELKGRRLCLTSCGREVVLAGERLLSVGQQPDAEIAGEVVTVEVAAVIDPAALLPALGTFLVEWAGLVTLRLQPLDTETLRGNLASGVTAFGVGFAEEDGSSGATLLERPLAWTLLVRPDHPRAAIGNCTVSDIVDCGRLFVPAGGTDSLATVMCDAGSNVVVLPTALAVRTAVSAGLGLGLDLDFGADTGESFLRVPLGDLSPLRLGLYLPRRPEQMTEAAKALHDAIREVFTPRTYATPHVCEVTDSTAATLTV